MTAHSSGPALAVASLVLGIVAGVGVLAAFLFPVLAGGDSSGVGP